MFATIVACDTRAQLERTVNVHARGETNKLMKSDCVAAAQRASACSQHCSRGKHVASIAAEGSM